MSESPIERLDTSAHPLIERAFTMRTPTNEPVTSIGRPRLGFHFGERPKYLEGLDAPDDTPPQADLIGQASRFARYNSGSGDIDTFVAELDPSLLPALTKSSNAQAFTDRRIDLDDLFGRDAADLYDQLSGQSGTERVNTLSRWLMKRIGDYPEPGLTDALRNEIDTSLGMISIDNLADRHGVSRRWVEKLFSRKIGLSPKVYARIVRCQAAVAAMRSNTRQSEPFLEVGYFDQSHMIKEFKKLLGMTPTMVLKRQYHLRA